MNKKIFFIIFFITIEFYLSAKNNLFIKLLFSDFDIETPFDISCSDFEQTFKNEIDTFIVINKKEIKLLKKKISSLEESYDVSNVDVRGKIFLLRKNIIRNYCFDYFLLKRNDKNYYIDDEFRNLIFKIVNRKE